MSENNEQDSYDNISEVESQKRINRKRGYVKSKPTRRLKYQSK